MILINHVSNCFHKAGSSSPARFLLHWQPTKPCGDWFGQNDGFDSKKVDRNHLKPVQPRQRMTLSCAWYSQHLLPLTPAIVSLMVKRDYFDVFWWVKLILRWFHSSFAFKHYKHCMTCLMISWLNDSIIQCTFLTAKPAWPWLDEIVIFTAQFDG